MLTNSQVHRMCAYIRTGEGKHCNYCKPEVETPYGPGMPGCYGLAMEAIKIADAILEPNDEATP